MPIPSSPAARLAAILVSLAAVYVALRVYPHELPAADRHPDFLATIFHSRALIFAGRITLLCLAAFVIFSIAARISNREWLTKAGPFEVAQAAAISESERGELTERANRAIAAAEACTARFERTNADAAVSMAAIAHLLNELKGARHD